MSPRDRKRDRVLKRRRETKKQERRNHDESHTDDQGAKNKSKLPLSVESEHVLFLTNNKVNEESPSVNSNQAEIFTTGTETEEKGNKNNSAPLTKEERQRLKNQQRKALRKQKKARKGQLAQEIHREKQKQQAEMERLALRHEEKKKLEKKQQATSTEFKSLPLGVQYKDIVVGEGGPVVQEGQDVRVNYKLRAKHAQGKILDASPDYQFCVGKAT